MTDPTFRRKIYQSYAQTHSVYSDPKASGTSGRFASHKRVLRKWLPENRACKLLDWGCGDGFALMVTESLGYRKLCGVDLSTDLLKIAKTRTSAELVCQDG